MRRQTLMGQTFHSSALPWGTGLLALASALVGPGCVPLKPVSSVDCLPANNCYTLSGSVVDENNNPIAGAEIMGPTTGSSTIVHSDPNGQFTLQMQQSLPFAYSVEAVGYAPVSRPIDDVAVIDNPIVAHLVLRAVTTAVDITVPEGSAPAVVVPVSGTDGTPYVLTVPPGVLVDPSGNPVTGTVHVTVTSWKPGTTSPSIPLPLSATPSSDPSNTSGQPVSLKTYGMVDIEVSQGTNKLNIKSGLFMPLSVTLDANSRAYLSNNSGAAAGISLYSIDAAAGLWDRDPNAPVSYNASTGVLSGSLPHLSPWNFDAVVPNSGGCVTGKVTCNGQPYAGQITRFWIFDQDEVAVYSATTDASGSFCMQIGSLNGSGTSDQLNYYQSMFSPLVTAKGQTSIFGGDAKPANESDCQGQDLVPNGDGYICSRTLWDGAAPHGAGGTLFQIATGSKTSMKSLNLTKCAFCPNKAYPSSNSCVENGGPNLSATRACNVLSPMDVECGNNTPTTSASVCKQQIAPGAACNLNGPNCCATVNKVNYACNDWQCLPSPSSCPNSKFLSPGAACVVGAALNCCNSVGNDFYSCVGGQCTKSVQ